MDKFDETRDAVLVEQTHAKDVIVALLEHISRGIEDSTNMPSQVRVNALQCNLHPKETLTYLHLLASPQDAPGEMEDTKTFEEKNLATAKRTMESLQAERKKRERELELLRDSEPKLNKELGVLRENISRMQSEMRDFDDIQVSLTHRSRISGTALLSQNALPTLDSLLCCRACARLSRAPSSNCRNSACPTSSAAIR